MNRNISKLMAAFIPLLFAWTTVVAQDRIMYIMKGGEIIYQSVVSDIDSIVFADAAVPVPETKMTSTCYVDRAPRFEGTFSNTEIIGGRLEIKGTATSGTYTSQEFSTVSFTRLVGSWSVSHTNATNTIEVEYRVRATTGTWSGWLSYRQWGFERVTTSPANGSVDATSGNARISVDEIMPLSGQSTNYNAFQYRLTLRRSSGTAVSPKVKAIAATLYSASAGDYFDAPSAAQTWPITGDKILRQQDVPTIGGSICSATSVTMLMVHKGVTDFPGYPTKQEYTAREVVRDPSYGYAGNWSFACSGMGSWGTTDYIAYVRHVYSTDEIAQILTRGPIAVSIRGSSPSPGPFIDTTGRTQYDGSGHLIVVRGFEMSGGAVSTFLISDPNHVTNTQVWKDYKVTPDVLLNAMTSRVAYVLE